MFCVVLFCFVLFFTSQAHFLGRIIKNIFVAYKLMRCATLSKVLLPHICNCAFRYVVSDKDDLPTWTTLSRTIITHYEHVAPRSQKGTFDSIIQVQLSHKNSTNQSNQRSSSNICTMLKKNSKGVTTGCILPIGHSVLLEFKPSYLKNLKSFSIRVK